MMRVVNNACVAYYRGAMGILLTYDVTDQRSFNSNLSNWFPSTFSRVHTHIWGIMYRYSQLDS